MQFIKTISIMTLFLFSAIAQAEIIHIDTAKTQSLIDDGIPIIDIRTKSEWKQTGIVEGSHLLTLFDEQGKFDIEKWMSDLDKIAGKDKPFMLICAVGGRTAMLSQYLDSKAGYTQVHNVHRGIVQWIGENKPVVAYDENAAAETSGQTDSSENISVSTAEDTSN